MANRGEARASELPAWVRERIREIGIREVSRRTGASIATVSHWANGASEPGLRYAVTLADVLSVGDVRRLLEDESVVAAETTAVYAAPTIGPGHDLETILSEAVNLLRYVKSVVRGGGHLPAGHHFEPVSPRKLSRQLSKLSIPHDGGDSQ
jgi:transcriptional regulator with XRE-family HTH domain